MSANFWGTLVKTLRIGAGVSQRALAAEMKISRSTLRRIEAGIMSGDILLMERILARFGHDLEVMCVSEWPLNERVSSAKALKRETAVAAAKLLLES